jgi:ABC-2 type transport system ATP-binding protein
MAEEAIVIRGLEKTFSSFKLGPLDLNVPKGAIYGLIGPNGAGKTTTIDLIMGMGRKDAGTIEVFGLDHVKEEVAVKKQIGYVSPDLVFNAWGKVKRLLGFIRSFYDDWDDAYCIELMQRLKIGPSDTISTLSFGARTKLGLIVALSHRPALLLLDEPLAGLDAVSKQEVFTELLDAVQDENRTVLISSHDLHDLERFSDHIGMIHNGNLLLEGPTSDLVERFHMVDCTVPDGQDLTRFHGVYPQKRDGNRRRVLVDMSVDGLQQLSSLGATDIVASPVTLEEILVGLVKER